MKAKTKNICFMYAIALLQGMVFYGPIATLYRQANGISTLEITVIESVSLALCLILEFPWGILADKIGYKKTILLCNILYFFSKIIFWKASCFTAFLLERVIISISIAGLSGVDTALLYLSCKEPEICGCQSEAALQEKSRHVFGIYNSLQTAGLFFAAFLFSYVIKNNYSLAAFLTVISYGIAALLSFGLTETAHKQEKQNFPDFLFLLKQSLTDKYLLLFLTGIALLNETHQTITVFLNQLQYIRCGLSSSAIGYIYIAVTISGLCGALSAKLTKKLGTVSVASFLFGASALSCLLLAVTDKAWLSVSAILILRIAFSLLQPLQTELQNRRITTGNRATVLSINAIIIDSTGIGTNLVFGSLAQHSLTVSFLFGALLCTVGGLFFLLCYQRNFHALHAHPDKNNKKQI